LTLLDAIIFIIKEQANMTISFFFGLLLAFCLSPGLCSEPWSPPELGDTTDLQQLHLNDELRNEWDHVPFQSRVVGGSVANGENYPWHVNLGGCGGTLVHEDSESFSNLLLQLVKVFY